MLRENADSAGGEQGWTERVTPRVALFSKFSPYGGVARIMVNLANALTAQGVAVDLLLAASGCPYPHQLDPRIRVIDLGTAHIYGALLPLARYLRRQRPDVLVASRYRASLVAVWSRYLAFGPRSGIPRVALRIESALSSSAGRRRGLRRWLYYSSIRRVYSQAAVILAVSHGVAEDFDEIAHPHNRQVHVVPNPVVTPQLMERAQESVDHPWFKVGGPPIILGVGRFTRRKDFATLVRAFAQVRKQGPCRLVLIGDGEERSRLEALAGRLGVADAVDFPGVTHNPYPYMARAQVLALSSRGGEGSPNVLKEAMALGLPVVSTDCMSGPCEILQGGRLGGLVPVGDASALAQALVDTLAAPPDPERLRAAMEPYSAAASARRYKEVLGLGLAAAPSDLG